MPVAAEEELVAAETRAEAGLVRARPIRMAPKEASTRLAGLADKCFTAAPLREEFPRATDAHDRVLGTELAGAISRARIYDSAPAGDPADVLAELDFNGGSVAGQGLGAFNAWGLVIRVEGGAQDGVAKTMLGGTVSVMKGANAEGRRVNGSVGKSFAYGAQRGHLFVQGSADSRFCIRLSGADVVLGGEPEEPLDDSRGCIVDRANAKGFAFEYMTSGRAVVMGDIGPWACAGMTGGRVYVRVNPDWNLDADAIRRRLGEGAKVELAELDDEGVLDVEDLLGHYADELRVTDQADSAEGVLGLAGAARENFLMIVPHKVQADPNISTE
jgi:glutamate synthase (NADPH/NADH) large chain